MEQCLKTHFYPEEIEMKDWKTCHFACLCESEDEGLPACPELWLVIHFCETLLLESFATLLNLPTTTTTPKTETNSNEANNEVQNIVALVYLPVLAQICNNKFSQLIILYQL